MTDWLLRAVRRILPKNQFLRGVSVLISGTAGAQLVLVLALPLLTRIYTPDDFGVYAIFSSILGMVASVACMRLEIAIPLPESDKEAVNIFALALLSTTAIAFTSGILIHILSDKIALLLGQPHILPYLWLIPLGVWISGSYQALQYWTTRKKNFQIVAKTKLTQAIGGVGTQLGLGWLGVAPLGLLLGQVISSGAGIIGLGINMVKEHRSALRSLHPVEMLRMLRNYKRFPMYSTFETIANTGGVQIPVLIIATLVEGPEVGYLMLASRIMVTPMSLIGGAVSQVYLTNASSEHRAGNLGRHTAFVIAGLLRTGVGPLVFIGIVAPYAFPFIFGPEWGRAGEIVRWMTPWFVTQFLVSPVSMALHVTGNQMAALLLQFTGLVIRVLAVIGAAYYFKSILIEVYAISGLIFYLIYFFVVARISNIHKRDLLIVIKQGKNVIAWIVAGFVIRSVVLFLR